MSTSKTYTRELKDNLNYTATWLPNVRLALGDVGVLNNYEFSYRTSLKNMGIAFQSKPKGAPGSYSHISSDAVERHLKLAGKAPLAGSAFTNADAGITFNFKKKDAVVFLATDCTVNFIADQDALQREILAAYDAAKWDKNYVVITELVNAGNTSVILAEGSEAKYELKAKAGLTPAFEAMNLKGNFSLAHDSQIGFNFLAESGLTPLFRCQGLVGLFRNKLGQRGGMARYGETTEAAPAEKPELKLDEVDYEDHL